MEKKITIAQFGIAFIFIIFILRLLNLQLIQGGEYRKIDERNRLRFINIPAPRGIIYDRNNRPLVKNIPTFDISIIKEDMPKDPGTLAYLGELIGLSLEEIKSRLSASSTLPFEPFKLKQNVSFEEVAKVAARRIDFPGLRVDVVGGREYIYGTSASHVIGYLGRLGAHQLDNPEYSGIPKESLVGQFGAEKVYDRTLRGVAGKRIIEVDAMGSLIGLHSIERPVQGRDIKLTIDIDLQIEAEKGLGEFAGAVVAIEPDTGDVLALYSAPSFDPNLFRRGIQYDDWQMLTQDPKKPMLNRAIQSRYPPGSTFKIATSLAALEENIVNENTNEYCSGSINYGRVFKCWKEHGHGSVQLHKAIVESCDVFFYEIGKKILPDTLARYAIGLGLGRETGIDLEGESSGIIPTSEWKRVKRNEKWFAGETLNMVIGQGYVSATPLQMAKFIAAVANDGKSYTPHIRYGDEAAAKKPVNIIALKPQNVKLVKDALMGVVSEGSGTGKAARSAMVSIGGKTGTSQVIGGDTGRAGLDARFRDHAWFVAFAPEFNPRIAVAVFAEHGGHGATAAAPVAKKVIEAYYRVKAEDQGPQVADH